MIESKWIAVGAVVAGLLVPGCIKPVGGLITTDEDRIWVVRDDESVYRCGDGAEEGRPPRPVCVRAPFADAR